MKNILFILGVFIFYNTSAQNIKSITYWDKQQKLSGISHSPKKNSDKGVLILPAWKGIDTEAKTASLELSILGYNTFVADIYGEENLPKTNEEAKKLSSFYKSNPEAYHNRINLALKELIKLGVDPNKIVVIGYCFGGTGALETARAQFPVAGVVSIHGNLSKGDRPNGPLATKILVLHGADDAAVSPEEIKNFETEMKLAKADWQMIYYANSKHTFTNPESADYNEVMAKRSWQHLLLFLKENLK